MNITLTHDFTLESAHFLPNLPEDHRCRRVHGHTFVVEVHVTGKIDPAKGWLMDYADLKTSFEPIRTALDHRLLNEIEGLENPTSELISLWIWNRLQVALPGLSEIVVRETCSASCSYRGD